MLEDSRENSLDCLTCLKKLPNRHRSRILGCSVGGQRDRLTLGRSGVSGTLVVDSPVLSPDHAHRPAVRDDRMRATGRADRPAAA